MKNLFYVIIILCLASAYAQAQTMNVTYKTLTNKKDSMNYTVSATYPQVNFGPDALMGVRGIAQDINNSLEIEVNGIIKSFTKDVFNMPQKTINGNGSSLEITSRAWVSNGSMLSTELTTFNSIAGMAHPMTTITTFNYNVNGAGPLTLASLFKRDADYLKIISTTAITVITAKAEKEGYTNINDMIISGAAADAKNFTEWTVQNDSLNIVFNPYQVAPYVFG
ncbi:MAG: RsiV family protein, partial [bacterium]